MTIRQFPKIAASAHYRVCINGPITASFVEDLCGQWHVEKNETPDSGLTFLNGKVRDQVELLGLLNQLNSYGYPLISVQFLASDPSENVAQ